MDQKEHLLSEVKQIIKNYKNLKYNKETEFNIFSILDVERKEVSTHSAILYPILNPFGPHDMGDTYLFEFFRIMGIPKDFCECKWKVYREFRFYDGRIDIFFRSHKKCIALEMKIDARDQERQLIRYEDYLKKISKDYFLIYLTLDKKSPSLQSLQGIDESKLICSSFNEDIRTWLKSCIDIAKKNLQDYSLLLQYYNLLEKIKGENAMDNEISNLINSNDDLRAAAEISNSLRVIKGNLLYDFFCRLKKCFAEKGYTTIIEEIECAKDYYTSYQKTYVSLVYPIKAYSFKGTKGYLGLSVIVEDTLYYCIGFYLGKDMEYPDKKDLLSKNRKMFTATEEAVKEIIGAEFKSSSSCSIHWQNIKDAKNRRFDFKNFSDSCLELHDNRDYEAERIADILGEIILSLKKRLE